jgi:serine/threonine protein kinase
VLSHLRVYLWLAMVARALVVGRYAVYDKIASGGMASVHFGRLTGSVGFTRTVAVKRLHPHLMEDAEFLKTMLDEARLASRIHHPNVVSTIDVVAAESELLVVMEYVRGESLARLLRAHAAAGQRPPLPIVSAIAVGALQGLHAAHEATSDQGTPLGIVHRDVSPQNILVGIDGAARIIDFGVAKAAGRLQTTREGAVKGKIPYMAPEQLGGRDVTLRADVYAMAVVVWEMIAGRKLFAGDVQATIIGQVLAGAKIRPSRYAPDLPEGLDDLVMKGLKLDPESRFESAREMAESLARLVPPSQPAEVGAWVQEVAKESLAQRGALLAEIESDSGFGPAQPREEALALVSRVLRTAPREGDAVREDLGTQVSSVTPATPAPVGVTGGRSVRLRLAGAAAVAVVAVAGTAALIHRTNREPSKRAVSSSEVSSADSTMAATSPPLAPSASVTAAPSVIAPPSSALLAASALPRATTSASRRQHGPPPRNCTPPFYSDGMGQKIFKPECFK